MEKINASEALLGFAGWLTCRAAPVTFSSEHDAAPAAELVAEFIKAHDLPAVRDAHYPANLVRMPR